MMAKFKNDITTNPNDPQPKKQNIDIEIVQVSLS